MSKKTKNTAPQYDHLYQIVLSGDSSVGKTALLSKFAKPTQAWESMEHIATIGVDFVKKIMHVEGKQILL